MKIKFVLEYIYEPIDCLDTDKFPIPRVGELVTCNIVKRLRSTKNRHFTSETLRVNSVNYCLLEDAVHVELVEIESKKTWSFWNLFSKNES